MLEEISLVRNLFSARYGEYGALELSITTLKGIRQENSISNTGDYVT